MGRKNVELPLISHSHTESGRAGPEVPKYGSHILQKVMYNINMKRPWCAFVVGQTLLCPYLPIIFKAENFIPVLRKSRTIPLFRKSGAQAARVKVLTIGSKERDLSFKWALCKPANNFMDWNVYSDNHFSNVILFMDNNYSNRFILHAVLTSK